MVTPSWGDVKNLRTIIWNRCNVSWCCSGYGYNRAAACPLALAIMFMVVVCVVVNVQTTTKAFSNYSTCPLTNHWMPDTLFLPFAPITLIANIKHPLLCPGPPGREPAPQNAFAPHYASVLFLYGLALKDWDEYLPETFLLPLPPGALGRAFDSVQCLTLSGFCFKRRHAFYLEVYLYSNEQLG